jgi:hypothetical protein
LPCAANLDVHPQGQGFGQEQLPRALRENRAPAESDHGRAGRSENFGGDLLLDATELALAPLEELGNGTMSTLELTIEIDEPPPAAGRYLPADRRLPCTHEPDEREVTSERAYLGDQSIRSR